MIMIFTPSAPCYKPASVCLQPCFFPTTATDELFFQNARYGSLYLCSTLCLQTPHPANYPSLLTYFPQFLSIWNFHLCVEINAAPLVKGIIFKVSFSNHFPFRSQLSDKRKSVNPDPLFSFCAQLAHCKLACRARKLKSSAT